MSRRPSTFIFALLAAAFAGSLFDLGAEVNAVLSVLAKVVVIAVFFAYGARLSTQEAWDGLRNWRLHSAILLITFGAFPLFGWIISLLGPRNTPFLIGILFLTTLPSTIQVSVNAVSIARGNTAAAVVSASTSNLLGVVVTPVLVALLIGNSTEFDALSALGRIVALLLIPFALGQLSGPFISNVVKNMGSFVDYGGILVVVFAAFAAGRHAGVWATVSVQQIAIVLIAVGALLALAMTITWWWAKLWNFNDEDAITVLFCGSQKSLASGLPIATIIFSASLVPLVVLPLMIYHQFQIIASAAIGSRLAQRNSTS